MTGDGKNEKNYGCVGSSGYGEFSSEQKWIEELQRCSNKILIHDLHKEYPNCIFNVDKEHELLEKC